MILDIIKTFNTLKREKREWFFPKTFIFNEEWLLKGVLESLKDCKNITGFDGLLPFKEHYKVFSEGQLKPALKKEGSSHVDGVVGDFIIKDPTTSGIELKKGDEFQYLALFEAKIGSDLSKGTKYHNNYSQISRLANCLLEATKDRDIEKKMLFIILLYPANSGFRSNFERMCKQEIIEDQLRDILKESKEKRSETFLNRLDFIKVKPITWKELLDKMDNEDLKEFYYNCEEAVEK